MGGRLRIAACCLVCLAGAQQHAGADDRPDRLHFEHIGEQDGAGPPFDIAVGRGGQSSYVLVLVSPPAYAALRALVSRAPRSSPGRAAGTFEVSEYAGGQLRRRVILSRTTMQAAVALIRRDSERHKAALPAAIAIQEQLLK